MNKKPSEKPPALNRKRIPRSARRPWLAVGALGLVFALFGCSLFWNRLNTGTLPQTSGTVSLEGLQARAFVRRDTMGIPFIEAASPADLAFATGYVHAADRLSQMISFKLAAQGRLAEMAGPAMLEVDFYLRALNIRQAGDIMYEACSEDLKTLLERYSQGVNAYLETYRRRLPLDIRLSGYDPDPWKPQDSTSVFALIIFGLSVNLTEEINSLNMLAKVDPRNLAWLFPIYPDEALPFEEAGKLSGLEIQRSSPQTAHLAKISAILGHLGIGAVPASNNWAVSGARTLGGKTILANDTHLPLAMPSTWNMLHMRCPGYDAAGVSLAGLPGVVAGYNGHIAWGMTMVMADTQDIFLEKLKTVEGRLHYLYQDEWVPTRERSELFRVKGGDPVRHTIYETHHGPLINDLLEEAPDIEFVNRPAPCPYGIAVSWAAFEPDGTIDAFLDLPRATSAREAQTIVRKIRAIPLNMVYADAENIGWHVTGRYPLRRKGRGLLPSPGWNGEYDWVGFLDPGHHPSLFNPQAGFVGTANHRTVPRDFPFVLSSSWYYPSRSERIQELLTDVRGYDMDAAKRMQYDVHSTFVPKLKQALLEGALAKAMEAEIASWEDAGRRQNAQKFLRLLAEYDGDLTVDSIGASLVGALFYAYPRRSFLDELGPEDDPAWGSLLRNADVTYSALVDHLLVRGDESPFWDDFTTSETETKAQILARSLADAAAWLEGRFGENESEWRWGRVHSYAWHTESYKLSRQLGWIEHTAMNLLSGYLNRGPFPAPGDHTTLNVAGYHIGNGFEVWLIPEMRLLVDFNQSEPLWLVNSSGQSGNPASPHYEDGIFAWLKGEYHPFPFDREAIEMQYQDVLVLEPQPRSPDVS